MLVNIDILADAAAVAKRAADLIAAAARDAVIANGRFVLAVSGGKSPRATFRALAGEKVPWEHVHLFQVDERVAPPGDNERNLTLLRESLLDRVPLPAEQFHAMPVEAGDLRAAARAYADALRLVAGTSPVFDLIHLGLGPDGHTASLVPHDPALDVADADVALTLPYQWRGRMTLTYPVINRARQILFVVTGADKAKALARLRAGDTSIPAGRVRPDNVFILADEPAASAK